MQTRPEIQKRVPVNKSNAYDETSVQTRHGTRSTREQEHGERERSERARRETDFVTRLVGLRS